MVARVAQALLLVATASAPLGAGEAVWPVPHWARATPAEVGLDEAKLIAARDHALKGDGSGMITRHGRLVLHWGDLRLRYDLKSTTKSFGAAALGLALKDGRIKSLDDQARLYHPTLGQGRDANAPPGWLDKMTIRHLLTQTAGFAKAGGTCQMLFEPGTKWAYSDSGPNWLAECITLAYQRDLNAVMFERLFTPLGIKQADLTWRHNAYRLREINGIMRREFGAGIFANVDAMARFGYLFLWRGRWQGEQLLPEDYVVACGKLPDALRGVPTTEPGLYGQASSHYGYLWWNNADGTLADVPRDAYWSWGLDDSLIVVIPSLDIVVARAGKSLPPHARALRQAHPLPRPHRPVGEGQVAEGAEHRCSPLEAETCRSAHWPLLWAHPTRAIL